MRLTAGAITAAIAFLAGNHCLLHVWLQANWLKSVGVCKGDAVAIYMPMVGLLPATSTKKYDVVDPQNLMCFKPKCIKVSS